VLSQGTEIGSNVWLRRWASSYSPDPVVSTLNKQPLRLVAHAFEGDEERSPLSYFGWYFCLSLVTIALYAIRTWWILTSGLRAAKLVYARLITRLLGSPISFFDRTPVGRIINRLSGDTKAVDEAIVDKISHLGLEIVWILGIIAAVAYNIPCASAAYLDGFPNDVWQDRSAAGRRHHHLFLERDGSLPQRRKRATPDRVNNEKSHLLSLRRNLRRHHHDSGVLRHGSIPEAEL
jgi:hypothetical protein